MSFLAPSDFKGLISQSKNEFTEDKIQLYINKFEVEYLRDLLGATMYTNFIADLDTAPNITTSSVPSSAKFTAIFNAFAIDEDTYSNCQHRSEGIKEMLKYFIYFEYGRDNQYENAITGSTKNNFSNSELIALNQTNAIENYNRAIKTYDEIQWYINDNPNDYDYSNYNGLKKKYASWL